MTEPLSDTGSSSVSDAPSGTSPAGTGSPSGPGSPAVDAGWGYKGPLSVEREHGAAEACRYVRDLDFPASETAFDAAFQQDE
jgi:hypothetical protein